MTEQELRESKAPWPKTEEELLSYIKELLEQEHDYGTCVYAMSLSAQATFNYVSHKLGVTGFQASCADLDFLRRTRNIDNGFMILSYDNLLYPQYCTEERFPTWKKLIKDNKNNLSKAASKLLNDRKDAHPDIINHWKKLAKKEAFV